MQEANGQVHMLKYRKGVFFVVFRKERKVKYLVLKRKLHWTGWEFCKGGVKGVEKELTTVKRELKEETGCNPVAIIPFNVRGKYKYKKKLADRPGVIGQSYHLFAVEVGRKKIRLGEEHSSYRWVDFKKAYRLLTYPDQRTCLVIVDKKFG